MAQQVIDYTAPDADLLSVGASKINANFAELYLVNNTGVVVAQITGDGATNEYSSLQSQLTAAAGKTFYIPKPSASILINAPLAVPANTTVWMHPACTIKQSTKYKPVFDVLSVSDVTIQGGHLRYEGSRTYAPGASVRGNDEQNYGAAIWTNSDRTVVRGVRAYGFTAGVFINGWNGTTVASYQVKDCVVEDLLVDTVDFGVLAGSFDGLRLDNIRGSYTISPSSPNPAHLIYITMGNNLSITALNRGLEIGSAYARDSGSADDWAFQFYYVRGGKIGRLHAHNCKGVYTHNNCQDLSIDSVIATADNESVNTGTVYFQDDVSERCVIDRVVLNKATTSRAMRIAGIDCGINSAEIIGSYGTVGANEVLYLRGTRCYVGRLSFRNTHGSGSPAALALIEGTDCSLRLPKATGKVQTIFWMNTSTGAKIDYDPDEVPRDTADGASVVFYIPGTLTTPKVTRRSAPKSYSTTGGAAVSIRASETTHAEISANATNAFTINAPSEAVRGMELSVVVLNNSGGTLGTITFNAVFKLHGGGATITSPTNGNRAAVNFRYDGTNWIEQSRSG